MTRKKFLVTLIAATLAQSALAQEWLNIKAYNLPDHYCRHRKGLGEVTRFITDLDEADGSFLLVPGLAGNGSVSFESKNYPGHYLRHKKSRIRLEKPDGTDLFNEDASFIREPGLASASWSSFNSFNYPGAYLRHRKGQLWVENKTKGGPFKQDATFKLLDYNGRQH